MMQRIVLLAASMLSGCVAGSGRLEERTLALGGFDAIDGSDGVALEIARGDDFAVAVTVDDNLWRIVDAKVEGGALRIGFDRSGGLVTNATLRARVTLPTLAALELSGAARALVSTRDEPRLAVRASGGSVVDAGALAAEVADVELSGASAATLTVRSHLDFHLSGASHLTYAGHPARGRADSSGGSTVEEL